MRIDFGQALGDEALSAVVPPPLCRGCRWCRPAWGHLIFPVFWPFPVFWHYFWDGAKCQHPTSLDRPSPDYVTGRTEKPRRLSCNVARIGTSGERCGQQARYWEARRYPAWLWTAGSVGCGIAILAAYVAFFKLLP